MASARDPDGFDLLSAQAASDKVPPAVLRIARHRISVVLARNGIEALDMLAHAVFDVVLVEVDMPIMDGPETVRRLRAAGGPNRAVPVIALALSANRADAAAGMGGFLVKPVDARRLSAAIETALDTAASDTQTAIAV